MIEQFLGFGCYIITQRIKELCPDPKKSPVEPAYNLLMEFLNDVNPNYAQLIAQTYNTPDTQRELIADVHKRGVFINVVPFTDGLDPQRMLYLRDKYGFHKQPVHMRIQQADGSYKDITTKKPVLIGEQTFYMLYKMPHQRCAGLSFINQYRTPIKPSSLAKLQCQITRTPIKLGEDECRNLIMVAGPEVVARIVGMYANSAPAVTALSEHLLFAQDPAKLWEVPMTTQEMVKTNAMVNVVRHIFSCFGVSISTSTRNMETNPYESLELPTEKK